MLWVHRSQSMKLCMRGTHSFPLWSTRWCLVMLFEASFVREKLPENCTLNYDMNTNQLWRLLLEDYLAFRPRDASPHSHCHLQSVSALNRHLQPSRSMGYYGPEKTLELPQYKPKSFITRYITIPYIFSLWMQVNFGLTKWSIVQYKLHMIL